MVFAVLIILGRLSVLFGWKINIMAIIAVIFDTLIIAGSIYKLTRKSLPFNLHVMRFMGLKEEFISPVFVQRACSFVVSGFGGVNDE